jgi:hypothetical protein
MSIALTSPYSVDINSVLVEDDTTGACTGMTMDFIANVMTYTFKIGVLTGSGASLNLNAGPYAQTNGQTVTVTVNMLTGAWSSTGPTAGSGVIPGSILNPIITQMIANRNTAEGFVAVSGGLMPGTTTAWTQL